MTKKTSSVSKSSTTIVAQIRERKEARKYAWSIALIHIPASSWKEDKAASTKEAQKIQDELVLTCSLEELVDLLEEVK